MRSIFDPLLAEGWTSLRVRHDWRDGAVAATALREWEPDRRFAAYGRDFDQESALTSPVSELDAHATLELYRKHERLDELEHLFALMRKGRHEGVDLWIHSGRNVRFLGNVHSSTIGRDNGRQAIRGGGIRRHGLEDPEREVLVDGLNLARGMSFKNAAAGIPYGGCKLCVHSEPIALDDMESLGFLAWCIDRCRTFTGPDMGLLPEHADVLRQHFTRNIVGGPSGSLGPTGIPTARGVFLALREAVRFHLGCDDLRSSSVAIQGLGAVGVPLAGELLAAGARRLLVADPDAARRDAFLDSLSKDERQRVATASPDEILFADVDVVAPCAMGGILGEEEIDRLRCRIVMGAANNQLRAVSREDELALAERLAARGILYEIDWVHNGGGVLAGAAEYERQEAARLEDVMAALTPICGEGVRRGLVEAAERGITPTALAYERIEGRIYSRDHDLG